MKLNRNLGLLSKYRGELMGLAILFILTFHAFLYISAPDLIKDITRTGRIGVDIFLILSAIGLYFSLKKKPSLLSFYRKRIIRILPTYFLLALPYFLYTTYTKHSGFIDFLSDITFLTSLHGGDNPYYFIELILICYLLMPLLFHLSDYQWGRILIIVLSIVCYDWGTVVEANEGIINRIPIFAISVVGAKWVYHKANIPYLEIWALLGMATIIIISTLIFPFSITADRISYSLFSIPILVLVTLFLDSYHLQILKKALNFCGSITLEIYMINFPVIAILTRISDNVYIIVCLTFIITITLSYIAHQIIGHLLRKIDLIS